METRVAAEGPGADLSGWLSLRASLAGWAARRGAAAGSAPSADRWWSLAARLAPTYGDAHAALVTLRRDRGDRPGALAAARDGMLRFPDNPDAWMRFGDACQLAYRLDDALNAYERVIAIEERADALLAAGELYARGGKYVDAAARFARAYAAGAGAAALHKNAAALFRAGDERAADEALALWATQVPDGHERLSGERAQLRSGGTT